MNFLSMCMLYVIQNAAPRLVFNRLNSLYVTPPVRSLHLLPISVRIIMETLVVAHRADCSSLSASHPFGLYPCRQPCTPNATGA